MLVGCMDGGGLGGKCRGGDSCGRDGSDIEQFECLRLGGTSSVVSQKSNENV